MSPLWSSFLQQLRRSLNLVQLYEDKTLQAKALSVVPVAALTQEARERCERLSAPHRLPEEV